MRMLFRVMVGAACAAMSSVVWAQEQESKMMPVDAKPVYEVATIKLTDPNEHNQGFQIRGRHVRVLNQTVTTMIMFGYGLHKKEILNGPDWISDQRFDVDGVPDIEGQPNLKQMQSIVRNALEERFGLKFHKEKRELTVYAVQVEKGGPKLEKSKWDPSRPPDQSGNGGGHKQFMKFTNNSMDEFAFGMQYFLDKPVVNQTGLPGKFDFGLTWKTDLDSTEIDAPDIFTAVKEQLGLRLEVTKAPVEAMVVDGITKPTDN